MFKQLLLCIERLLYYIRCCKMLYVYVVKDIFSVSKTVSTQLHISLVQGAVHFHSICADLPTA